MFAVLPLSLLSLLSVARLAPGSFRSSTGLLASKAGLLLLLGNAEVTQAVSVEKRAVLQTSKNGSSFIWTIQDTYAGETFFECVDPITDRIVALTKSCTRSTFDFFTGDDPTQYVSQLLAEDVHGS